MSVYLNLAPTVGYVDEIGQILDALNGGVEQRAQAQRHLIALGAAVVDPLLAVLMSESHRRPWIIAQVLGEIGDPRAINGLISALRSNNPLLSSAAAKSLTRFHNQRDILPILLEVLSEVGLMTQQSIILVLQELGDKRAVQPLIDQLSIVTSPTLRCAIIKTLGNLGDPSALPIIRPYTDDPDHHVREWANLALQQLGAVKQH